MNEPLPGWILRIVFTVGFLITGSFSGMLAAHRSSHPIVGHYSPSALAALVLAGTVCTVFGVLSLLPRNQFRKLEAWINDGIRPLAGAIPTGSRRNVVILAALALLMYCFLASVLGVVNSEPRDDQRDYLIVSREIRRMGGVTELWRQLWSGTYQEANRHPLYTAILANVVNFDSAKRLSQAFGLVALTLFWWDLKARSGGLVAGVAAILLATNQVFQQSATLVACEMLLTIWCLLAWIAIERVVTASDNAAANRRALHRPFAKNITLQASGPRNPADSGSEAPLVHGTEPAGLHRPFAKTLMLSGIVGVALGLGYLTKASAVFLLAGFLVWSCGITQLRRWSWLAVVTFIVVSAPLLVRNAKAYGNPLYSFNNRFLFADSFDEGIAFEYRGTRIEAAEYWHMHSFSQIARRVVSGLGWEGFILLRSLAPASLGSSQPLVGFVILLLAAFGIIGTDWRVVTAAASWIVPFYVFFAWYVPIAAGDRFLAPLIPILLGFAGRGAVSLIQASGATNQPELGRTQAAVATGTDSGAGGSISPARESGLVADWRLERRILIAAELWCLVITVLMLRRLFV